jgi:protein pelota
MHIISEDPKKGDATLRIDSLDDLWYLSQIIEKGDKVKGKTIRKMKGPEESSAERISVYLEIAVEKVEWSPDAVALRVGGVITQGPEDVPHGSHHSFSIEPQTVFTMHKETWLKVHKERLKEAQASDSAPVLLVLFDREEVYLARLKKNGVDILVHEEGNVQKKGFDNSLTKDFFEHVVNLIVEYQNRHMASLVVVASPSFWKEELLKRVRNPEDKKRWVLATVSDVSAPAFNELLKRPEVKQALSTSRVSIEATLVENLLAALAKNQAVTYGWPEVTRANMYAAIENLLISTEFIKKRRENDTYSEVEAVLKEVEKKKGNVHIVSSQHDGGKKLDGLGGIAAMLRFTLD